MGWSGKKCELDMGFCGSDPCKNDATCINLFQDYFCVCPSGEVFYCFVLQDTYMVWNNMIFCTLGTDGKQCETAPNRCIGDPCQNKGVCSDFGSGLNCSCPVDYIGVGCQYEFDACAEGVCQNGATCVDNGAGYKCHCPEGKMLIMESCRIAFNQFCRNNLLGFTGKNCEKSVPHCKSNSCPPTASCVDLSDGFYCKCPFNLTGEDCRKSKVEKCTFNMSS